MRAHLTLFSFSAALIATAQLGNGGFESLTVDANAQYWSGDLHILAITLDSNGVWHTDSVVYDGGRDYALSTDAHSGQYAMELRNGYNFTQAYPIVGRLHADADTNSYQSFPIVSMPMGQRPVALTFWAKYAPLGNDSAEVTLNVLDEAQNPIGSGALAIGGTIAEYTAFEVPVTYTSQDPIGFVQLTFANGTSTGSITLGTRMLIDDVALVFAPEGIAGRAGIDGSITLYPVPAADRCTVRTADGSAVLGVQVFSAEGRLLSDQAPVSGTFDTSGLPVGMHIVAVRTRSGIARTRLLVAR